MALPPRALTFHPTLNPCTARQDTKVSDQLSGPEVPCMPFWQNDKEDLKNERKGPKENLQRK